MLELAHLESLVDVLFRHDALMHACAIDVSREDDARVERHKAGQCDGMTKHITSEHHAELVRQVWDLRRVLEGMPRQLYIQCVLMKELVRIASEEVTLYFAQRRPRELAKFEWTIDAKDPRRITSQEKWWREVLAVWLESASRREPFIFVKDAGFNYKYFNRSFAMTKEMWFPDRPREIMEGPRPSKNDEQANGVRGFPVGDTASGRGRSGELPSPLLAKQITSGDVSQALGRLQIRGPRKSKHPQSLRLVTLSHQAGSRSDLGNALQVMTSAARAMLKPERAQRRSVIT
jgi:hypothetical protein